MNKNELQQVVLLIFDFCNAIFYSVFNDVGRNIDTNKLT